MSLAESKGTSDMSAAQPTGARSQSAKRNLARYTETVKRLAAAKDATFIDASHPAHFAVVMRTLFANARDRVLIFSDHLCRYSGKDESLQIESGLPIWTDEGVISSAEEFLQKDTSSLEIIVREDLDAAKDVGLADHPFVKRVVSNPARRGMIFLNICLDEELKVLTTSSTNFAVASGFGYRFETASKTIHALARLAPTPNLYRLAETFADMRRDISGALGQPSGRPYEQRPLLLMFDKSHDVGTPDIGRSLGASAGKFYREQSNCKSTANVVSVSP